MIQIGVCGYSILRSSMIVIWDRSKTSGFTMWAVVGVLGILLFRSVQRIPMLTNDPSAIPLLLFAATTIVNIMAFGTGLYLVAVRLETDNVRLASRSERAVGPIPHVFYASLAIILSGANFWMAYTAPRLGIDSSPFWISGVVVGLTVPPLLNAAREHHKYSRQEFPMLSSSWALNEERWVGIRIAVLLLFLTLLMIAMFAGSKGLIRISKPSHVEIVKWAIEIAVFLALLTFVFRQVGVSLYQQSLARLEQRIVLESLEPMQIREIFIRDYLAKTLTFGCCNSGQS